MLLVLLLLLFAVTLVVTVVVIVLDCTQLVPAHTLRIRNVRQTTRIRRMRCTRKLNNLLRSIATFDNDKFENRNMWQRLRYRLDPA